MSEWKETEIGNIPKNWNITTIAEVIQDKGISVGVMYPGEDVTGGIPLIRVADIKEGKINPTAGYRISSSVNETHKRTMLNGGEVIVTLVGNPGATVVVTDEFKGWNVARAIGVMKLKDQSDGRFISYSLNSPYSKFQIDSYLNTTVQPTLNLGELKQVQIPWPDKAIRSSIAEVLSSLDDKIDLLHRNNKTLEQMAETLFKQWLNNSSTMEETTLGEYCKAQGGYAFKGGDFKETGNIGVLKIKNISFESVDVLNTQYIDEFVVKSLDTKFKVAPGAFLIAMTGAEIGKIGIVGNINKRLWLNQRVAMLVDKKDYGALMGYLMLKSESGQDYILNTASGSAQENISSAQLEALIVPKVRPSDLISMGEKIKPLIEKKQFNLGLIQKLEETRDTLLPKLMSGQVRVKTD